MKNRRSLLFQETEMTDERGRLTPMKLFIKSRLGIATSPEWATMDKQCDEFGLPRQWIVCPNCGAQSWRLPPHGFESCPIVIQMAESAGMKFDAERSSALRLGVHMEEMTRAVRQMQEEEDEE